jgi:hypothetical protein
MRSDPPPLNWSTLKYVLRLTVDLPPFVIHGLCNFSGLVSLLGEGVRGQAAERHMWPGLIVISPPVFDPLPGISHGEEPRGVQAFRPQAAVERLNVGIVRGRSGPGEVNLHPVQIGPLVQALLWQG